MRVVIRPLVVTRVFPLYESVVFSRSRHQPDRSAHHLLRSTPDRLMELLFSFRWGLGDKFEMWWSNFKVSELFRSFCKWTMTPLIKHLSRLKPICSWQVVQPDRDDNLGAKNDKSFSKTRAQTRSLSLCNTSILSSSGFPLADDETIDCDTPLQRCVTAALRRKGLPWPLTNSIQPEWGKEVH